jgi:hypothetical protein
MASWSELVGIVLIEEGGGQMRNRIRREVKRIGWLRFLDVIAFRLYYAAILARHDGRWLDQQLTTLAKRYPTLSASVRILKTHDPNAPGVRQFLEKLAPDLMIARCKRILKEPIFAAPKLGTFVLHPGICPQYRNAHGAFWALAQDDVENAGLTLLRIDKGVDTGPVFGYFFCMIDEVGESHIVVMTRLVLENFDRIRDRLLEICAGTALPLDTAGRPSAVWGQPWLTKYLRWKWHARRRRSARAVA